MPGLHSPLRRAERRQRAIDRKFLRPRLPDRRHIEGKRGLEMRAKAKVNSLEVHHALNLAVGKPSHDAAHAELAARPVMVDNASRNSRAIIKAGNDARHSRADPAVAATVAYATVCGDERSAGDPFQISDPWLAWRGHKQEVSTCMNPDVPTFLPSVAPPVHVSGDWSRQFSAALEQANQLIQRQNERIALLVGQLSAVCPPLVATPPGPTFSGGANADVDTRLCRLEDDISRLAASLGPAIQQSVDKRVGNAHCCSDVQLGERLSDLISPHIDSLKLSFEQRFADVLETSNCKLTATVQLLTDHCENAARSATAGIVDKFTPLFSQLNERITACERKLRVQAGTNHERDRLHSHPTHGISPVTMCGAYDPPPRREAVESFVEVHACHGGAREGERHTGKVRPVVRNMSISEFLQAAELCRKRLPHRPPFDPPLQMLANMPWIDKVTFAELGKRIKRPVLSHHFSIVAAIQDQADIDEYGPPDDLDKANTRELKITALGIIHSTSSFPTEPVAPPR